MLLPARAECSAVPERCDTMRNDTLKALAALLAQTKISEQATTSIPAKGKPRAKNPGTATEFTVRPGKRAGVVQLFFAAKPTEAIRVQMKSEGFRFTPTGAGDGAGPRWYGPENAALLRAK